MAVGQSEQTDTDVANLALDLLGQSAITNLNAPQTTFERTVQRLFPIALDIALKKHWWTPLRKEVSLPSLADPDEFGVVELQLPSDCLQVWTVNGNDRGWERRSGQGAGKIAGNMTVPARVIYAARLGVGDMPYELLAFIGAELAVMLSTTEHISLSRADRLDLKNEHQDRLDVATDIVGIEGGAIEPVRSRFVDALHGYSQ